MKRKLFAFSLGALFLASSLAGVTTQAAGGGSGTAPVQGGDQLLYADFEAMQDGRPVSSRGGRIQLYTYEETATRPTTVKGLAGLTPPAPELVRVNPNDPNKAMTYNFEFAAPNQWAGAGVEVYGLPEKDGKAQGDDVSRFKKMAVRVYAVGTVKMNVEFLSRTGGRDTISGFHQMAFRIQPGFNTYEIELKKLKQPPWAPAKIDLQDVLHNLTSVQFAATCEALACKPGQGTVVIDDIVFKN
jgi:hypothetical protein